MNLGLRPIHSDPVLRRRAQRGAGLLEAVLFIVFAVIVVVGSVAIFQQVLLTLRSNDTSRTLVAISTDTRGLHQNARSFGSTPTDLTQVLITSGAVPSGFVNEDRDGIVHPWDGAVTVTAMDQQFAVTLAGLPSDACARLAPVDGGGQGSAGIGIAAVSFDYDPSAGTGVQVAVPFTPAQAVAADACGDDTTANLTFIYDR